MRSFFILSFHGLLFGSSFAGCAVFVWLVLFLVFLVFAFFVLCGMTSYDLTPRVSEAVTASASLAAIKTASKHLHNDLARAIEALEQKTCNFFSVESRTCRISYSHFQKLHG